MSTVSAARDAILALEIAEQKLFELRRSLDNKQQRHGEYYNRVDACFESVGDNCAIIRNMLEWWEIGSIESIIEKSKKADSPIDEGGMK